ncbi:aldose 1-epimerase family protein [Flavihumibacter sp. CACIAM 22H1]|uniref:aldose 1-epimerase family protein n=1 Tax=Flavihumibacter sp. CACIAM 22H1 TaxID=1812911 RepID=UPI0007A83662|nr:aldose 1-epimerase family protein [Flavihumibacter sp. CACIAM 22H1]KYP13086.1 MAG: aldose epimerase [Flavihumibacter sp. CACIAM 22H1]
MKITLENEAIRAVIDTIGAELQELKAVPSGINYLWSGDPAFWGKFSPILFPIVGTLKENTYFYKNHTYSLPRHGFAREKNFECIQQTNDSASFLLTDDASTKEVFPFSFQLVVRYTLHQNLLACAYMVTNPGSEDLYFSLGAHPAFAVPQETFSGSSAYTDYYLQFDKSDSLQPFRLDKGLIGEETAAIPLSNRRLQLDKRLFQEDAIVLKNLPDTQISLRSHKHAHGLDFRFEDFPFFGIWAAPNAPFVCLEPWCGIADSVQHNQQLEQKEGVIRLQPQAIFERKWTVTLF